jgi:hypothetical protein
MSAPEISAPSNNLTTMAGTTSNANPVGTSMCNEQKYFTSLAGLQVRPEFFLKRFAHGAASLAN